MRICREHIMAICVDREYNKDELVWKAAVLSRYPEFKQKTISKIPPPEREIVFDIKFCQLNDLLTSDTRSLSTFGATQHIFFTGNDVRTEFLNVLTGLLKRLVRDNPNLKFYGVHIVLLFSQDTGLSCDNVEENTSKTFSLFYSWCAQISSETAVAVTFDIVSEEGDLATVLKNEIRRIKHGDMMAQFGGAF